MSRFIPPPMPPQSPPPPPPPSQEVKKRARMQVRWPAIFPLVLFIGIQLFYGWPEAKERASGPEYAISYLMGGIMGGILVSYIVASITFRLAGRSPKASTIAFSAALLLFSVRVFQNNYHSQAGEATSTHLEFRPKPLRALGNKITINFPEIARVSEVDNQSIILRIADSRKGVPQMQATVELVDLANPDSFEVVRDRMGKSVVERLNLPEAANWRELSGPTRRAVTQAIPSADRTHRTIFALIDLEPKQVIVISLLIFTDQQQAQSAYADMADKIVKSIKLAQ